MQYISLQRWRPKGDRHALNTSSVVAVTETLRDLMFEMTDFNDYTCLTLFTLLDFPDFTFFTDLCTWIIWFDSLNLTFWMA